MSRWKPGARANLEKAALELYVEQGFESTTVAEIAARAGLSERTFYRHFADKREVLFPPDNPLAGVMVAATRSAGDDEHVEPLALIARALAEPGPAFAERGDLVRQRQSVIDATPELRERELAKLSALATDLAGALRARGVEATEAALAAQIGVAVFKVAFEGWVADADGPGLDARIAAALDVVRELARTS